MESRSLIKFCAKTEQRPYTILKGGVFGRVVVVAAMFCLGLPTLPGAGSHAATQTDEAATVYRKPAALATAELRAHELYPADLAASLLSFAERNITEKNDPSQALLQSWCRETLETLDAALGAFLRKDFAESQALLERLEQATVKLARLRQARPTQLTEYAASTPGRPSNVLLEELQLALERRVILWRLAFSASAGSAKSVSRHFEKGLDEILSLKERTKDVEAYFLTKRQRGQGGLTIGALWCDYLDTQAFLQEMDACSRVINQSTRRVSSEPSQIPLPMLVGFCDRANVILCRIEDPSLSRDQAEFLNVPAVAAWKEELSRWTADTVSPVNLLRAVERFEQNGGMSDMETLFRLATRGSFSPTPEHRLFGSLILDLYGNANVKVYISNVLVNHFLPPMEPEEAPFRETIQGQPVFGRRQADMDIKVNFIPDAKRLRLTLDVDGSIQTRSRASAFASTLFNTGYSEVEARKLVEMTEAGFQLAPATARVKSSRLRLSNFQTEFDGMPLLGGLFRGVVRNQYEARQPDARQETLQKMLRQLRGRVDKEAEDRFKEFNAKYNLFRERALTEFGLHLEQKNASTEDDWLLASWVFRSQDALAGHTPAPETLPGSFADLKVHESILNTMVGKLQLDGKSGTVADFKEMIAEHFHRPELAEEAENDDVEIAFADYNPVTVRFTDGTVVISIAIKALKINRQTHRDFRVIVRYRPTLDEQGQLVLRRDGIINLINGRAQFVLRAVFGKIFPEQRPVPLAPRFLREDERFAGLTTGHCRIEKGWFALALVAAENAGTPKTALSERAAVTK